MKLTKIPHQMPVPATPRMERYPSFHMEMNGAPKTTDSVPKRICPMPRIRAALLTLLAKQQLQLPLCGAAACVMMVGAGCIIRSVT